MANHGPQSARRTRDRVVDQLPVRERFLIVCEGAQTERLYFESFRVPGRVLEVRGTGMNTLSLVNEAMRLREEEESRLRRRGLEGFDQCWCVFDHDAFPPGDFNSAIDKARANHFRVAYSNEAFELWYLLHFDYHEAALHRNQYCEKLTELLGRRYEKSSATMYQALLNRQQAAIRNAKALLKLHGVDNPEQNNPSTTVHELVEELNKSTGVPDPP